MLISRWGVTATGSGGGGGATAAGGGGGVTAAGGGGGTTNDRQEKSSSHRQQKGFRRQRGRDTMKEGPAREQASVPTKDGKGKAGKYERTSSPQISR